MAKTILMMFLKVGEFAVVMATTTKNAKLVLSILDTWHENNSFQVSKPHKRTAAFRYPHQRKNNSFQVSTPEKEHQLPDVRNNSFEM